MNIYLDTIGCRLNQSEIESFAWQFRAAGHQLVSSADLADLVVINTCTVTAAAAADSRQKLRQAARTGCTKIVATGCWATLEPALAAHLPGVNWVIANQDKEHLVPLVLQIPVGMLEREAACRQPIPGTRQRTRAFIKVQDGCNNRCAYCITCLARGPARSRPIKDVLDDIRAALLGGAQEIVLTGVHLGAWGADFSPPMGLEQLIKAVLMNTDTPRLRLSSLESWDIQPDFFTLWENHRLCRHLHLPLQSGCAATLQCMARKITPEAYAALLQTARSTVPQLAITTDIITGFPGETEAEFQASLAFVERMNFAGGHVFTYSERPGTLAARLPAKVPHNKRKERNALMQTVFSQAERTYQQSFLGQELDVLWEKAIEYSPSKWELSGLTDNYLRVHSHATTPLWNQITPVKLIELSQYGLIGQIEF